MGMADNRPPDHRPYGMEQRVQLPGGGITGLSFVIPVCEDCGALVVNEELHDNFHLGLTALEAE